MFSRCKVLLTTISFLALAAGPSLNGQDSKVRIVRVSYAEGVVQLNNQNVTLNMPIIEGNVLTTGPDSVAEVQFEDGSTMRLSPETQVSFAQLARLSSGEAVTRADLDLGEAEFTIASRAAGMFAVFAHNKSILFKRAGRFRVLSTNADPLELAVWKGEAAVHDPDTGTDVEVKANETFTLAADDPQQYDLEKGIEADDLDRWSLQRDQELASNYVSVGGATPAISSPGFVTYGYVDPCQPYYWASYWTLPGYCFTSNYSYPPIGYGFVYFPGHHRFHHHPHPPHIHPPTPPVTAKAVKTGSGSALVNARSASPAEQRSATRVFNDENFKRSAPVLDKREMKEAEREAKNAEREMKNAEREAKKQGVLTTTGQHAGTPVSSQDSGHAAHVDSGRSSQPQHAAPAVSRSTYSSQPSSSGSSGSHSYSGSSAGSSHSSSSSHSSGSSSSGSSSHSSSSSSGGRGK